MMEYGGSLFAYEDDKDLKILDNIQMEALHIVSGAKKRTSHDTLKKEANWPDFSTRRTFQQVTLIHKVVHKQYPKYLLNSLPPMSDSTTRPPFNHAYYRDSVILKSISNWNDLPNHIRVIGNVDTFKNMLKREYLQPPNPLYHYGKRPSQMSHTRIRVKFSNLNFHLFNYNLVTDPNCSHCQVPKYTQARSHMLDIIKDILQANNLTKATHN